MYKFQVYSLVSFDNAQRIDLYNQYPNQALAPFFRKFPPATPCQPLPFWVYKCSHILST